MVSGDEEGFYGKVSPPPATCYTNTAYVQYLFTHLKRKDSVIFVRFR
jgi:hypothetical protein